MGVLARFGVRRWDGEWGVAPGSKLGEKRIEQGGSVSEVVETRCGGGSRSAVGGLRWTKGKDREERVLGGVR